MATVIKQLYDESTGNDVFPVASTEATYDKDGVSVDVRLKNLTNKVDSAKVNADYVANIGAKIDALPEGSTTMDAKVAKNEADISELELKVIDTLYSDVKTSPNTAMADFTQTHHSNAMAFTNKNIFNYVKHNDFYVFVKYITIKVPSSANGVVTIYKMGYNSTSGKATNMGLYKSVTLTDSMKVSGTDDVYKIVINDIIDFVPAFKDFYMVSSDGVGGVASDYDINYSESANQEYAIEVVWGVVSNNNYGYVTINFLGDSITEQRNFTSAVVSKMGCVAKNYGVSGTTITSIGDNTSFVERYSAMGDADVIFVLGGVNDWQLGRSLGTFEAGKNSGTFYGALHTLFEGLRNKYPNKPILCGTPLHANYVGATIQGVVYPKKQEFTIGDNGAITSVTYGNGAKLSDYVTAIKRVAEYYAIPVVDFYGESGMCPMISSNSSQYFNDGLHPNANGGNKMAVLFADALSKVL